MIRPPHSHRIHGSARVTLLVPSSGAFHKSEARLIEISNMSLRVEAPKWDARVGDIVFLPVPGETSQVIMLKVARANDGDVVLALVPPATTATSGVCNLPALLTPAS